MHTLRPADIHVLLVDDDKVARLVVGNLLRKCEYRGGYPAYWKSAVAMCSLLSSTGLSLLDLVCDVSPAMHLHVAYQLLA